MGRVSIPVVPRAIQSRLIGACVAMAALFMASRAAEASCGDWLAVHGPTETHVTQAIGGAARSSAIRTPASLPALPRCDGPACRGIPSIPALPRESSSDLPSHDPADRNGEAEPLRFDDSRPIRWGVDRPPVTVVISVPIRPPRRSSLQA